MKTDRKLACELQKRLMQTCIDYINEIGDEHIEEVSFRADSLQCSAEAGEWRPESDSSCLLFGIQEDKNDFYLISESY